MKSYVLYTICILYLLFVYGCQQPTEPEQEKFTFGTETNAILPQHEKECNILGDLIIDECMAVTPKCFELKAEWDQRGCGG